MRRRMAQGLAGCPPPLRFSRIDRAAFAGVDRLPMFRRRPLAIPLQLLFRAETEIGLVLAQQPFGVLAINIQPVGLTIRP